MKMLKLAADRKGSNDSCKECVLSISSCGACPEGFHYEPADPSPVLREAWQAGRDNLEIERKTGKLNARTFEEWLQDIERRLD